MDFPHSAGYIGQYSINRAKGQSKKCMVCRELWKNGKKNEKTARNADGMKTHKKEPAAVGGQFLCSQLLSVIFHEIDDGGDPGAQTGARSRRADDRGCGRDPAHWGGHAAIVRQAAPQATTPPKKDPAEKRSQFQPAFTMLISSRFSSIVLLSVIFISSFALCAYICVFVFCRSFIAPCRCIYA